MTYMQKWKTRVSFLLVSTLFSGVIAAPNVFAASYNFTDVTPTGPGHNQDWSAYANSIDKHYIITAVDGGDIWASSDYGQTWTDVTATGPMHNLRWQRLASSDSGHYMTAIEIGTSGGTLMGDIWASSDYGQTWTNVSTLPGNAALHLQEWSQLVMNSDGSSLAVAADYGDIWTSNDYGQTWTDRTPSGPLHGIRWWDGTMTLSGNGRYLTIENGTKSSYGMWASNDYGQTWTEVIPPSAAPNPALAVSANRDSSHLVVSTFSLSPAVGELFSSTDHGQIWADISPTGSSHNSAWVIAGTSTDGSHLCAVGFDLATYAESVWTSSDYGQTWAEVSMLSGRSVLASDAWGVTSDNTGRILVANDGTDTWLSTDYGQTWTNETAGTNAHGVSFSNMLVNSTGSMFVGFTNGGDIWSASLIAVSPAASSSALASNASVAIPKAPDTGYGMPSSSDPLVAAIIAGAVISTGAGLLLLYRQKRAKV